MTGKPWSPSPKALIAELARRQYKAIRTSLLCVKARALARLGRHADASAALAGAVRVLSARRRGSADRPRGVTRLVRGPQGRRHQRRRPLRPRHRRMPRDRPPLPRMVDRRPARRRAGAYAGGGGRGDASTGHHAHVTAPERRGHDSRRRTFGRSARASGIGHPPEHDAGGSRARGQRVRTGIPPGTRRRIRTGRRRRMHDPRDGVGSPGGDHRQWRRVRRGNFAAEEHQRPGADCRRAHQGYRPRGRRPHAVAALIVAGRRRHRVPVAAHGRARPHRRAPGRRAAARSC